MSLSCLNLKVLSLAALLLFARTLCAATDKDGHAEVLIAGDSMMRSVARSFEKAFTRRGLSTTKFASIGTRLARLDLLDWPAKLAALARAHTPARAIVMMGANDNQPLQVGGGVIPFGTDTWQTEYGRRVGKAMDALLDADVTQLIWVGLPCMREKRLDADVRRINEIVAQQAAARRAVVFVPVYALFSKDGAYSSYVIGKNGLPLEVRSADGIHMTRNGAELLVEHVLVEGMQHHQAVTDAAGGVAE
jgi:uncharacterized protein